MIAHMLLTPLKRTQFINEMPNLKAIQENNPKNKHLKIQPNFQQTRVKDKGGKGEEKQERLERIERNRIFGEEKTRVNG